MGPNLSIIFEIGFIKKQLILGKCQKSTKNNLFKTFYLNVRYFNLVLISDITKANHMLMNVTILI